jgi:exosortase
MISALKTSTTAQRISLALLGATILAIVCWQPFAAGYASERKTLFTYFLQEWGDPTWQHGALVPLIVGYLVWLRRKALAALPLQPSAWGLPLLSVAMLSYFIGFRANNFYFGMIALQLGLAGGILWMLGWGHLRLLFFAWCVLAFAWPLRFLEDTLGFQLRIIMVQSVAATLHFLHLPIIRDGTSLLSVGADGTPTEWLKLNVDGPCSGMRSLFALMFVSMLFSYFSQSTILRRLLLFVTSIPLAIAGNMVRIFMLIGGTAMFGQKFAVGDEQNEMSTYHFFSGIVVFIVAVAGLRVVSKVIDHWWPGSTSAAKRRWARSIIVTRVEQGTAAV